MIADNVGDVNYKTDSLKQNRVHVYENQLELDILEYKAPKSSIVPTSIVILLDVSASMLGVRFDILKKTEQKIIEKFEL